MDNLIKSVKIVLESATESPDPMLKNNRLVLTVNGSGDLKPRSILKLYSSEGANRAQNNIKIDVVSGSVRHQLFLHGLSEPAQIVYDYLKHIRKATEPLSRVLADDELGYWQAWHDYPMTSLGFLKAQPKEFVISVDGTKIMGKTALKVDLTADELDTIIAAVKSIL